MKISDSKNSKSDSEPGFTKSRIGILRMVAILIPFAILVLLEFLLRILGYGHDLGLFVKSSEHPGFMVMNKYASQKYFSEADNSTFGNYEEFPTKKGTGTYRIFVLGESTTIGYPYFYNGSFHRWLQYRLMHTYPDVKFEIINVSLTAVNSQTVLGFGKEVANFEPDAVLIYTGHNEYYGAMGVGSTSAIGGNGFLINLILKLREFRLVQMFNKAVFGMKKILSGTKTETRDGLMKRMAADLQIVYGSDIYQQGIRQFDKNMGELLGILNEKGIPVFLSNIISNEKDLKPFISSNGSAAQSAQYQYQLANEAYRKSDYITAKELYIRAKDLDLLRFRAPTEINRSIDSLVKKYPNAHLVDTKSLFERNSPNRIIGKETLLEHVHPNLFGYALLSEAFFKAILAEKKFGGSYHEMSFEELRREMPITVVDSLRGAYEIAQLRKSWPFDKPVPKSESSYFTFEEKLAGGLVLQKISWGDAMTQLLGYYQKSGYLESAMKVSEALTLEHPYEPYFYIQAGRFGMQANKNEAAVFYLKRAFFLENSFETARDIFITLLKLDKSEEAFSYLTYAAEHNTTAFSLNELVSFVNEINGLKSRLKKEPGNPDLHNSIAAIYLKFANVEAAEKYIDMALKVDPGNTQTLMLRKQIQDIRIQSPIYN